jgi:tetratricopeptide (TPR) repeat protein
MRKKLELDPNFAFGYLWLGNVYGQKGMYPEAIAEIKKGVSLSGDAPEYLSTLGYTYALSGRRAEARKTLKQLEQLSKRRYVSPYDIAQVYVGLGEKDNAFDWLQKALADRSYELLFLRIDERMAAMRSDPRFQDLIRRLNLPS